MRIIAVVLVGLWAIIPGSAIAQQETTTPQLEDSAIKEGSTTVKDSYLIERLGYLYRLIISVQTSYEVGTPDKSYGMTIRIIRMGPGSEDNTLLFDFGEAVSLSEALDYMVIKSEEWDLENTEQSEVYFRIEDNFRIGFRQRGTAQTVFAQSGDIYASWQEYETDTATLILRSFKALIDKGLDKLRSLGAK